MKLKLTNNHHLWLEMYLLVKSNFIWNTFFIWCRIKDIKVKLSITQSSVTPLVELVFRQ